MSLCVQVADGIRKIIATVLTSAAFPKKMNLEGKPVVWPSKAEGLGGSRDTDILQMTDHAQLNGSMKIAISRNQLMSAKPVPIQKPSRHIVC